MGLTDGQRVGKEEIRNNKLLVWSLGTLLTGLPGCGILVLGKLRPLASYCYPGFLLFQFFFLENI